MLKECKQALKTNKSSGLDGLVTEFYKMFWDEHELGNMLVNV